MSFCFLTLPQKVIYKIPFSPLNRPLILLLNQWLYNFHFIGKIFYFCVLNATIYDTLWQSKMC